MGCSEWRDCVVNPRFGDGRILLTHSKCHSFMCSVHRSDPLATFPNNSTDTSMTNDGVLPAYFAIWCTATSVHFTLYIHGWTHISNSISRTDVFLANECVPRHVSRIGCAVYLFEFGAISISCYYSKSIPLPLRALKCWNRSTNNNNESHSDGGTTKTTTRHR